MKKNIVAVGILMLVISATLSGCIGQKYTVDGDVGDKPSFDIISKFCNTGKAGYDGTDTVVWVDVLIINSGCAGSQTVFCQIYMYDNEPSCMRSERIYLDSHENTVVTFRFHEWSCWSMNPEDYLVWFEYK